MFISYFYRLILNVIIMKKIILSVLAVGAMSYASAQDSGTKFGLKAGLNLANLSGDVEDVDTKLGAQFGAFAEIMVTENFAVQPELVFSMQGAKTEYTELGANYEEKLNLSYLNIPIMAKYYVTPQFNIHAGPQVGFLMSAKNKYEVSGGGQSASGDIDLKDLMKSVDFGLGLGVGYNFTDNLGLEARYTAGLSNIYDDVDELDVTVNNMVIQFAVVYKF